MSANQGRGYAKSRKQSGTKSFSRGRKPGFGRIPVRHAVFSLTPQALQGFLDLEEMEDGLLLEERENEELIDEDSDLDDFDDDELPDSGEGETYNNQYLARLGESFGFSESPLLALGNIYVISISQGRGDVYTCGFDGPSWFSGKIDKRAQPFIEKLILFMRALGSWLEEEKQVFLRLPTAENYACGESFPSNPVVLQDGMLARVNSRLDVHYHLTKQDLSRLLSKVWLLWPGWNMPLRNLFSKEFRTAWVVHACIEHYRHTGVCLEELGEFTADDLKVAKEKDFGNLMLEERFRVLCNAVDITPKKTLEIVNTQVAEIGGNGT